MRRGFSRLTPRRARHAISIARNSGPASPARETGRFGFNTHLAQRELRARGGSWFEGRIAECPRLQQKCCQLLIDGSLSSSITCRHSAS